MQKGSFGLGLNPHIMKDLAAAGEAWSRTCRPLGEALKAIEASPVWLRAAADSSRVGERLTVRLQPLNLKFDGLTVPQLNLKLPDGFSQAIGPCMLPSFTPEMPVESPEAEHQQTAVTPCDTERAARLGRDLLANNRRASLRATECRRQHARERDARLRMLAEDYRRRRPDASRSQIALALAQTDSRSYHTIRQKLAVLGFK